MERSLARAPSHPKRITSGFLLRLLLGERRGGGGGRDVAGERPLPPLSLLVEVGGEEEEDEAAEEAEETRSGSSSSSSLSVTRTSLSFPRAGEETTARCLLLVEVVELRGEKEDREEVRGALELRERTAAATKLNWMLKKKKRLKPDSSDWH